MEKRMPNLALMWYQRALETERLKTEEKQSIWYEIGNAYEAGGEPEKALENFERIYALNVDYRDVGARIENLHISA
jgi:tetratricopeptide (TPR) repeat protein